MTIIDLANKFVDSVGASRIRAKAEELDPKAFAKLEGEILRDLSSKAFGIPIPGTVASNTEKRAEYFKRLTEGSKGIIREKLPEFLGVPQTTDGTGSGDPFDINLEKTKLEKLVKQTEHYERILEVGFEQAELEKQIAEFKESASEAELQKIENGEINIKQLIEENQKAEQLVKNAELVRAAFRD